MEGTWEGGGEVGAVRRLPSKEGEEVGVDLKLSHNRH